MKFNEDVIFVQPRADVGVVEGGMFHRLAVLAPARPEIHDHRAARGAGFFQGGHELLHAVVAAFRGDIQRAAVTEGGEVPADPAIPRREAEDENAECAFDARHPRARFGQERKSGGGERPRNRHAQPEYERQREAEEISFLIKRGGEQQHGDDDRGNTRTGEQRRNTAHHAGREKRAARRIARAAGALKAREINRQLVEHCQTEQNEHDGDGEVEPRGGVDQAEL